MEMLPEFPKWYQSVDLQRDPERLKARWAGVAELCGQVDPELLDLLVDLAIDRPQADGVEAFKRFVDAFKNHDPYFEAADAANEHALLAAAALAVVLAGWTETEQEYAIDAALQVTAALHNGGISSVEAIDLDARARHALKRLGEAVRDRRDTLALNPRTKIAVDFQQALGETPAFTDTEGIKTATTAMARVIAVAIDTVAKSARADLTIFKNHIEVKDEELEMLWWAFNEESASLGKPFSKLSDGERALVGAVELAERTRMKPGPVSAKALLMRAGSKPRAKMSVEAVVNACDKDWLTKAARANASHHTPIHLAIAKRLEAGTQGAWASLWRAAARVSEDFTLPEAEIAYLFYVERLFLDRMEAAG